MKNSHNLCLQISDFNSIEGIVNQASRVLRRAGLKERASEMYERTKEATSIEEVIEIIDEYVEII